MLNKEFWKDGSQELKILQKLREAFSKYLHTNSSSPPNLKSSSLAALPQLPAMKAQQIHEMAAEET